MHFRCGKGSGDSMVTFAVCDTYPIWDIKLETILRDGEGVPAKWRGRKGLFTVTLDRCTVGVGAYKSTAWDCTVQGLGIQCPWFRKSDPLAAIEEVKNYVRETMLATLDTCGVTALLRECERALHPMQQVEVPKHGGNLSPPMSHESLEKLMRFAADQYGLELHGAKEKAKATVVRIEGKLLHARRVDSGRRLNLTNLTNLTFNFDVESGFAERLVEHQGKRVRLTLEVLDK